MQIIQDLEAEAINGGFLPDIKTSILVNPSIFVNTTPQVNALANTALLGGTIGDSKQKNGSTAIAGILNFLSIR
jgi:hypothetical protein